MRTDQEILYKIMTYCEDFMPEEVDRILPEDIIKVPEFSEYSIEELVYHFRLLVEDGEVLNSKTLTDGLFYIEGLTIKGSKWLAKLNSAKETDEDFPYPNIQVES